jgi:hypothetical protein
MQPEKRRRLVERCRRASAAIEECGQALAAFGMADPMLPERLRAAAANVKEIAGKVPREWMPANAGQLATACVLCDPDAIGAFIDAAGSSLSPEALELLRTVQRKPAFFTAFEREQPLGEDLFRVRDISGGRPLVIESPSLAVLTRNPSPLYFTLLFSNGECLQALGPLHYLRGIIPSDLHCYASLVRPEIYERKGLSAVMTDAPDSFIVLDAFSETPALGFRGKGLVTCTTDLSDVSLDPSRHSKLFEIEEAQGIVRLSLKGCEPPLGAADFYWDPGTHRAFVHTHDPADHAKIAEGLAAEVSIPADPERVITANMELIVDRLLGQEPGVLKWEKPFEPPPPTPAQAAEMKRLNAFVQGLTDAHNHGRPYDLERLAARHGVPSEAARQIEASLLGRRAEFEIDVEGGLPGVPVPPPSELMKYRQDLKDCKVFSFNMTSRAQELFAGLRERIEKLRPGSALFRTRTLLALPTLPQVLEELDDWPDDGFHHVLKHSLYLLAHAGGEYHGSDDYAAELLRLFWQALLGSRERSEVRRFVRQYSIWCSEVLVRTGLVEAEPLTAEEAGKERRPGAPFRMRATEFLRTWLAVRGRKA